jgi:hypothetical protein
MVCPKIGAPCDSINVVLTLVRIVPVGKLANERNNLPLNSNVLDGRTQPREIQSISSAEEFLDLRKVEIGSWHASGRLYLRCTFIEERGRDA